MTDRDPRGLWGPIGSPQTGITYGDTGIGKDTDLMYAFPDALYLGKAGSLDAWHGVLALPGRPRHLEINTIDEAINVVNEVRGMAPEQRPIAVVISDLSLLATTTLRALREQHGESWTLWGAIKERIELLADLALDAGCHLWMNAHVFAPRTDDRGSFWPGGPQLPSKTIVRAIPHAVRNVFRAEVKTSRNHFWQAVFQCDSLDKKWLTKSRLGYQGTLPMNTAELLRARGYVLPRVKNVAINLEWQDEVADRVVGMLDDGVDLDTLVNDLANKLVKAGPGFHPRHLQWAIRDGIDRREIRDLDAASSLCLMAPSSPSGLST